MNSTGTPQSMLYQMRGQSTAPSDGNGTRNRKVEQQHSYNSGNPMNYMQYLNGQDPSLGRYTPPTLSSQSPTSPQWNNNQGGYAYNLPTSFGGFGGFSQYSKPPEGGWSGLPAGGGFGGGPTQGGQFQNNNLAKPTQMQKPAPLQGGGVSAAMDGMFNMGAQPKPAMAAQQPGIMPPIQGQRSLPPSSPSPSMESGYRGVGNGEGLSFEQLISMMRSRQPSPGITPIAGEQY